jgi:hypothetical protein
MRDSRSGLPDPFPPDLAMQFARMPPVRFRAQLTLLVMTAVGSRLLDYKMNLKMLTHHYGLLVSVALLGAFSSSAQAANFSGRFSLAQSAGTASNPSVRYYAAASGLSIYATGLNETLLHEAFFRKSFVDVSYNLVVCPLGIVGTCGSLVSVTVDAGNFP